jgi:Type VI secretion system (T6SS), amidase effector protein 4
MRSQRLGKEERSMSVSFSSLSASYPTESKQDLYNALGGEWPGLVDSPNFQNTCCIRLSMAILGAGGSIPANYKEGLAGDGRPLIIKVVTMGKYVKDTFGDFYWGMSKNPGTTIDSGTVPGRSGIIVYHVAWQNATGHFDLWTGSAFVGSGNFDDIHDGYDIALWTIP